MKKYKHWYLVDYVSAKDMIERKQLGPNQHHLCMKKHVLINRNSKKEVLEVMNFLTYQETPPRIISIKRAKKRAVKEQWYRTFDFVFEIEAIHNRLDKTPLEILTQYYL